MEVLPGAAASAATPARVFYLVRKVAAGDRPGSAQRQADARREQPAGGQLLAEQRRRAQVRQGHRREHRPATWRSSSTTASCRRRASKARSPTRAASPAASRRRRSHDLSLTLRSGALPASPDLPRGARRSARRSAPTRSAPACIASLVGLLLIVVLHARLLQAVGRQRGHRAGLQPGHPARPDGVHRRDDDAAGHRRLRADDGHRRRLERADLRAHQGGAGGAARRARRRSTPASTACS